MAKRKRSWDELKGLAKLMPSSMADILDGDMVWYGAILPVEMPKGSGRFMAKRREMVAGSNLWVYHELHCVHAERGEDRLLPDDDCPNPYGDYYALEKKTA